MRNSSTAGGFVLGLLGAALIAPVLAGPQEEKKKTSGKKGSPTPADMAAAMAKAKRFTEPGEHHKLLTKFVGTWETETTFPTFPGPKQVFQGTAAFEWLMEGRWLKGEVKGQLLGRPSQGAYLMGYDNFRKTYVSTSVSSMDTAMNRTQGHAARDRKAIILYGTIDEYLSGEQDKPVKQVWRFLSDDEVVQEVHDLAIGEENTKVVEVKFKRVKKS